MAFPVNSRLFGVLPTGEAVEAWILAGAGGMEMEVITYGGIVRRLVVPDCEGNRADVVLGFNDLDSYVAGHPYFGAITGRVAGRLSGASFHLEGTTYALARNDPPNHLHGGIQGFDKKIWMAAPVESSRGASLKLAYRSVDGEEGYPGTVDVTVTYTVTPDNVFLIETEAVTDRSTPCSLTHHSYFNLAGEGAGSIAEHELTIHADQFVGADASMTLLGRLESVEGTANDFRKPRHLGDAIPQLFQNHGALHLIRNGSGDVSPRGLVHAARLAHPDSGRVLDVFTTEQYLQLYTASALDGTLVGKSGVPYGKHCGICLECEGYSDGPNAPNLGNVILRRGHPQCHTTAYAFSTEKSL
jgi:aldose 1-epimerase